MPERKELINAVFPEAGFHGFGEQERYFALNVFTRLLTYSPTTLHGNSVNPLLDNTAAL